MRPRPGQIGELSSRSSRRSDAQTTNEVPKKWRRGSYVWCQPTKGSTIAAAELHEKRPTESSYRPIIHALLEPLRIGYPTNRVKGLPFACLNVCGNFYLFGNINHFLVFILLLALGIYRCRCGAPSLFLFSHSMNLQDYTHP